MQGETAHHEISQAIRRLFGKADVIIVARGGGSFEDLFPFNNPDVVMAIAASPVPVVSAIGHEVDVTLAISPPMSGLPRLPLRPNSLFRTGKRSRSGWRNGEPDPAGLLSRVARSSEEVSDLRTALARCGLSGNSKRRNRG